MNKVKLPIVFGHRYRIECYDRQGRLKWVEELDNLVVNEALDDILNVYYKGTAAPTAFYVGLTDANPTFAAGDTMAAHAGWTENTSYSETARPACTFGAVANQSVDNSASPATFSISAATTIGGAFLTTDATKGGTLGKLIGGVAFTNARGLAAGDTLNVTVTASMSSA